MQILNSAHVRVGLLAASVLLVAAGLFVIWTALGAAGPEDEDEGKIPQPPPYERGPAPKAPRPDESKAMTLTTAKAEMSRNDDLARIINAVESGDVDTLIDLAKKTNDYCGIYREVPEGCETREDKISAVFFDGGTIYPKPAALMREWIEQLFKSNPGKLSLATRDSRKPEGDGGVYYLVFNTGKPASTGDGTPGGTTNAQGIALVVTPGSAEPIERFGFLSSGANGLWWIQDQGGKDGAKYQLLLTPQSVKDWPGAWGETGD